MAKKEEQILPELPRLPGSINYLCSFSLSASSNDTQQIFSMFSNLASELFSLFVVLFDISRPAGGIFETFVFSTESSTSSESPAEQKARERGGVMLQRTTN